ncbi:MAG: hypothetical protein IJB70_06525 [Clostridia bacterium]|nr:hypothetical protein [Clostridia bacterium]
MRKILSIVTALMILSSALSTNIFASDASNSDALAETTLLYDLGVVGFDKPSDIAVTRAEFTRYAMKLADIPVTPHVGTVFSDVTDSNPDYNYIMSAVDFGMISKAESYRPNDTVTLSEAIKIIVTLLGYDYMAEVKGGYPQGYLQTARDIELLDGVGDTNGEINQPECSLILCNALNIPLPEITYTENGATQYRKGSETILRSWRGIKTVNGIVDGNAYYSVANSDGLGEGRVSINGEVYNSGKINTNSLFGYDVEAYVDIDTNTVVSCSITESNKVLSIYAEDIVSYNNRKFVYTDANGKDKTVSIGMDTDIFLNGKMFAFDSAKAIPESGSLTFIAPNGSDWTTLLIKSYKTTVVDRISKSDNIYIDKYSPDNNLYLDPDETEIIITNQNGEKLTVDSITIGDVLCAAISDDGKIAEIILVRDSFRGTYSGYGNGYIQIDGTNYKLSSSISEKVSDIITLGKDATFKLDADHRVADIIPVSAAGEEVGYLIVGKYSEKGMSKSLNVCILKLDGTIGTYTFADTFTINGTGYKDIAKAWNAHKSPDYNSLLCGMVKYKLNSDNELTSLTYSDKEGGNGGLYVTQTVEKADEYHTYQQWFNSVGNDIICDTSLKIFKVPNPLYSVDNIDLEQYTVEAPSYISANWVAEGHKLVGYTTKPDDGLSQYLLMQKIEDDFAAGEVTISGNPYMVNAVKKVIHNEEYCEAMELCNTSYSASAPLVVYSKGENDFTDAGVKGGDIVRINTTENSIVRGFEIIYKKGDKLFSNGTTSVSNSNVRVPSTLIKLASAHRLRSQVLDVIPLNVSHESATESDYTPIYFASQKIQRYDDRLKCVVDATLNDIKDYETFGKSASTLIYYRSTYGHASVFLIDD